MNRISTHKMSNSLLAVSFIALVGMLLTACGGTAPTTTGSSSIKTVALVTDIGGLNDQGFNQLSYAGYTQAQKKYGFPSEVIQTQSTSDYVQNLTRAAESSDLVIGVGFLMATAMDTVARQYPTKHFALIDACPTKGSSSACDPLPNVAPLYFSEQQAGCLVGAAAGQMEIDGKSQLPKLLGKNTIGAVGGISSPPVDSYIAGYQYCAQKVDPSIKVVVEYSQSFDNTAACSDTANSEINQDKADIIFQVAGGCGIGALNAANQKGVYSIGVDSDQNSVNASVITSAIKRVDQAVYQTTVNFEAGKFSANPPAFDLKSDGVGYSPLKSGLPANVQSTVDSYDSMLKAGKLTPPTTVQK
jgi:basic membrane protein A